MRGVIAYLMLLGVGAALGLLLAALGALPLGLQTFALPVQCALMGALGGVVYCLRGVYLSRAVRKDWSEDWLVWYFVRPWVSLICGGVAFVILKAGLLALDADQGSSATQYGFLAFAFIAGLNVDGLLKRLEGVAQAGWGIDPSRASSGQGSDLKHS